MRQRSTLIQLQKRTPTRMFKVSTVESRRGYLRGINKKINSRPRIMNISVWEDTGVYGRE